MTAIEKKKLVQKITNLESENEMMKKLLTRKGFYECYFELLKCSKTRTQAFNKVNKLYFQLFGEKRFSNFSNYSKMVKI